LRIIDNGTERSNLHRKRRGLKRPGSVRKTI